MNLLWYWRRLRAMEPSEPFLRVRKKFREIQDSSGPPSWPALDLSPRGVFPKLPDPLAAPESLRRHLAAHVARILQRRWLAFGRLPICVDDPPCWQKDYLAGKDLQTTESAFKLNYRKIQGADSKLIWELSRWFELVRLGQGAYVLQDVHAAEKCRAWLGDWVVNNPPFRGWNWISALESGMRLIQFAWLDALLNLHEFRDDIIPAHFWHAWRHRSFGSSANNHLLGELAGLIVALVRWPGLAAIGPSLELAQNLWEIEVLAQFAPDGGNREQALNYHLYSWEFCWHAYRALEAANRPISSAVTERLRRAEQFFLAVQVPTDPWDYGDSDDAFVVPVFAESVHEWWHWFGNPKSSPAINYWCRMPLSSDGAELWGSKWRYFSDTGIARMSRNDWDLRWDLSPLGYKSIAAHGHLDALHLSIWYKGKAVVIDPGTGAYFADSSLRNELADWKAHNGPHLGSCDYPRRDGTFLWGSHHEQPLWPTGELRVPQGLIRRTVAAEAAGWRIEDSFDGQEGVIVRWQFPPGSHIQQVDGSGWRLLNAAGEFNISAEGLAKSHLGEATVSSAFRQVTKAPFLEFSGMKACVLRTKFLTCKSP